MDTTHDSLAMANPRKRPRSRGSTDSIQSTATTAQAKLEDSFAETSEAYAAQWLATSGMPDGLSRSQDPSREMIPAAHHQMTTEDLLLASQLQAGSRDYMEGPVVGGPMHSASFHHHSQSVSRQSMSAESFTGNGSFADDSQMLDRDGNEDGESFGAGGAAPKPMSRTSANNELEMRQLFTANQHRNLQDVAEELHGNERGPNSERTRQVFAMLWINQVCSKGKGSVPRGRVYANYASRCATERITVLNPASFGKLVRVLFPGLKTRRLGVRGESKYHYVNFALAEEASDVREPPHLPTVPLGEGASFSQSFNTLPTNTSVRLEQHSYPTLDTATAQQGRNSSKRLSVSNHGLYNHPMVVNMDQLPTTSAKTAQEMQFATDVDDAFHQSEPLMLPSIEPFLPAGTDVDAAKSLVALYRSHCTSLVECIRYCKEKTFFHLFTSFQGTLTMPVQKLFSNPAVAPWIEECDFVLYQRMVRIVSGLTLQVVPKPVLDTLRNISGRLVAHIRESFQGQPAHVVRAKEAPATIFASLLDKALRVNLTAHAAANMLSNSANRDLMYLDWITTIQVRKVAECVPMRGMDDVVNVLLTEIKDLLDPVDIPWDLECLTIYGEVSLRAGREPTPHRAGDSSASNVLDRWVSFLQSLPARFPYASATEIVWCVQRVGTVVMRDLTMAQGKSFGSWWVTKCWIDEMIQFLAEQGGFMKQKSTHTALAAAKQHTAGRAVSNSASRYSSASDDFNLSHISQSQPDRAPFPSAPASHSNQASHDDSGIGIRTPDEEPLMDKFAFTPAAHTQDLFAGTELQDL